MRIAPLLVLPLLLVTACGRELTSTEQAQRAYLGLDASIGKALALGFAGFNAATSANIPPQSTTGDASGTLTITGQVDQGVSANKQMQLRMGMVDYSDGEVVVGEHPAVSIVYDTATDSALQPALDVSLQNVPDGTYSGALVGDFTMEGDVTGAATLDLAFSGAIESDGSGGTRRVPGSTTVTGTATAGGGTYDVNLTL